MLGYIIAAVATVPLITIYYKLKTQKSNKKRFIENFQEDLVYFFQFPTSGNVSCISPYAVKVETWLRLKKIKYEAIRTITQWSAKKQIPFIELNGEQIADSNFIIDFLTEKYDCHDNICDQEKGIARAVEMMLDNHTVWTYFYYRYVERASRFIASWTFTSSFKRKLIGFLFPRGFKKRSYYHGVGRHSPKDIYKIGMKDLSAISSILGDKQFLFGDSMTTVDCYMFGHLSQILYIPSVDYPHINYLQTNCPNLVAFCDRVIDKLWPEWHEFQK